MDLLKSKIKPMYLKYLLAAAGSAMVASIFGMVDAMMVGKYHGPAGNAALAVFTPLWSLFYSLGLLAGIGGSVLFANKRGSGDEQDAQEYFTLSVLFGAALSVVAMVVIGLFHEPLFRFFGADDELLSLAKKYLRPIFFAIKGVKIMMKMVLIRPAVMESAITVEFAPSAAPVTGPTKKVTAPEAMVVTPTASV